MNLPDLESLPILHKGKNCLLYYVENWENGPAVLKTPVDNPPSASQVARLNNEYILLKNDSTVGTRRARTLEKNGKSPVLVLDYLDGMSLRQVSSEGKLGTREVLGICAAAAMALHELHETGIIHRNITSGHIMIEAEEGPKPRVTYIDLGMACRFDTRMPARCGFKTLDVDLQYISPEQTGRINRAVDLRSDLYALGITLYEAFCGRTPFADVTDELELIHSHIARTPVPAHEVSPQISRQVSDILSRLLAKSAEERYQSAHGAAADFQRCLKELVSTGKIPSFPLSHSDTIGRLMIPQRLYGREEEAGELMECFEQVCGGETRLMLVTGPSGAGKSVLIHEVHKPITEKRGYFISGKYEQYNRDVPYSAIAQALDNFCNQVLTESETRFEEMRSAIQDAVGEIGGVLTDIFPRLELIIGRQTPVAITNHLDRMNQLNLTMQRFMGAVCTAEHPLVLFLDDLQWADQASLNVLRVLLEDESIGHLLLLGAYRDNEVDAAHPLTNVLAGLEERKAPVNRIGLEDLSVEQVNNLISDALTGTPANTAELAESIVEKTGGNAFFSVESLKWLYDEKAIVFDAAGKTWQYDKDGIRAGLVCEDAIELTQKKINSLSGSVGAALSQAACIGHLFDLQTLSSLHGHSTHETMQHLRDALESGFISALDENYRLFGAIEGEPSLDLTGLSAGTEAGDDARVNTHFRFIHDRVHQAAYTNPEALDEKKRVNIHLKIGRMLLDRTSDPEKDEGIFTMVNHLNKACGIMDKAEHLELASLNLIAGRKARNSTAYDTASRHFALSIDLLPNDRWDSHYDAVFSAKLAMAETEYLAGRNEEADALYHELLKHAGSAADEIKVRAVQNVDYTLRGQFADALEVQRAALTQLGIEVPATEEMAVKAREKNVRRCIELMGGRSIESLASTPELQREDVMSMLEILNGMWITAYCMTGREQTTLWVASEMAVLSYEFGNSELAAPSYVAYGLMLCLTLKDYKQGYEIGKMAIGLCEKYDNLALRAYVYDVVPTTIATWRQPLMETVELHRRSVEYGLQSGNFAYASYSMMFISHSQLLAGRPLEEVHREALRLNNTIARTAPFSLAWSQPNVQHIACLLGLTISNVSLDNDDFNEEEHARDYAENDLIMSWVFSPKLQLFYHFGHDREALELVSRTDRMVTARISQVVGPEIIFFTCLVLTRCFASADKETGKAYLKTIESYQERMKIWADNCEANYLHKYLLVEAEKAKILGHEKEAGNFYNKAVASALQYGFTNHAALGNELAARFYFSLNDSDNARRYMHKSVDNYIEWGAVAKVEYLSREFAKL